MENHPFKRAMAQLTELLQRMEEAAAKGKVKPPPQGLEKAMRDLEGLTKEFHELNERLVQRLGMTEEQVKSLIANPPAEAPPEHKELIERTKSFEKKAKTLFNDMTFGKKLAQRKAITPKQRSSKFTRTGARKKWKPI